MKIKLLIIMLIIYIPISSNTIKLDGSLYLEPLAKPGISIAPIYSIALPKRQILDISLPKITYFYYPDNYNAIYIYPEITYRYNFKNKMNLGLFTGAGLSLSKKVVPVYNMDGELISDPFLPQLFLKAGITTGYTYLNNMFYLSIGWKGLYPYNLSIQNQPFFEFGYQRRVK